MMHQGLCDVSLIFLGFPLTVMHRLKVSFHSLPVKSLLCFPFITPSGCVYCTRARECKQPFLSQQFPFISPRILFSFLRFIFWNFHRPWRVRGTSGYEHATNHHMKPVLFPNISHKPKKVSLEGFLFISTHHDVLFARAPKNAQATIPILETKTRHFPEGKKGFSMFMFSLCYGYGPIDKQRTW